MNVATPSITHREHGKCGVLLCGVKVEDENENGMLVSARLTIAFLVTDDLAQITNFMNIKLGKVVFFTFFVLFLN